ncbi:hypothetical protein ACHAXR_005322, partial [Thalassiosira sp. AJA248-18]
MIVDCSSEMRPVHVWRVIGSLRNMTRLGNGVQTVERRGLVGEDQVKNDVCMMLTTSNAVKFEK